ncbi:MAG: metalloregulator ArsR/SmtB family transcription factor [Treponema sp.]|jgi:DNA-binding transcriptional ArsR family regulator|nr:metalloregulator ArsR/SmtB family transcription factor [Treponema sp.]
MIDKKEIKRTLQLFKTCGPLFLALGDNIRQNLLLDMANAGDKGMNVTELTANTHLSRPAISHHLKVLKDSHLIKSYKIGPQVFYSLDLKDNIKELKILIASIEAIVDKISAAGAAVTASL